MKIAIIGATGKGLTVAAYLQKIYPDVTILDVPMEPLEQIQSRGVTIYSSTTFLTNFVVKPIEACASDYDFVFLFAHPFYNKNILPILKSTLQQRCFIVSFQENLSDWELIQSFQNFPVLSAVCKFETYVKQHHQVVVTSPHTSLNQVAFDLYDSHPSYFYYAEEVKSVLDTIGCTQIVRTAFDIKWTQAIFSGAIDRLASALNCLYGDILHHPIALQSSIHLVDEIVRIAKKYNITLAKTSELDYAALMIDSDTKIAELIPIIEKLLLPYQKIPSNQDAYLIDELLEVASLVDQPTPYLETLAHCLHEKNEEDFHRNIACFQPLVTGTLWRQE